MLQSVWLSTRLLLSSPNLQQAHKTHEKYMKHVCMWSRWAESSEQCARTNTRLNQLIFSSSHAPSINWVSIHTLFVLCSNDDTIDLINACCCCSIRGTLTSLQWLLLLIFYCCHCRARKARQNINVRLSISPSHLLRLLWIFSRLPVDAHAAKRRDRTQQPYRYIQRVAFASIGWLVLDDWLPFGLTIDLSARMDAAYCCVFVARIVCIKCSVWLAWGNIYGWQFGAYSSLTQM